MRFVILLAFVVGLCIGMVGPSEAQSRWPASKVIGSLDLGSGTIRGGVSVETFAITGTEAAAEGQWIFITAAVTRTLPAVATSGQSLCYYTTGANVLTIDPASSEIIVLDGTPLTGGVTIVSSGAAGEFACLLSNGTNWYVLGASGTWAAGS